MIVKKELQRRLGMIISFLLFRLQHNKKYLRRQARRIQEQSRQNREQQFHPQGESGNLEVSEFPIFPL